jgi:hypothetical protein
MFINQRHGAVTRGMVYPAAPMLHMEGQCQFGHCHIDLALSLFWVWKRFAELILVFFLEVLKNVVNMLVSILVLTIVVVD